MESSLLASTAATHVVAVDAVSRNLADVEHLVHLVDEAMAGRAGEASYVVSTHTVSEPDRHFAAVLSWAGGPPRAELVEALTKAVAGSTVLAADDRAAAVGTDVASLSGLAAAVVEHVSRSTGRLARYPGRSAIERRLTVSEVVEASCVEEVAGLAGTEVRADSVVDLTGFARPEWRAGRCVLLVQPGATALLPFEAQRQIPCCADH